MIVDYRTVGDSAVLNGGEHGVGQLSVLGGCRGKSPHVTSDLLKRLDGSASVSLQPGRQQVEMLKPASGGETILRPIGVIS